MKVCQAMANAFIKEGTTTLFGLLGDGQMTWWSAMSQHAGLKIIDVRDEGAALTMAEGWAMATGKVSVCSATQGPGLARMTTALIVATPDYFCKLFFPCSPCIPWYIAFNLSAQGVHQYTNADKPCGVFTARRSLSPHRQRQQCSALRKLHRTVCRIHHTQKIPRTE